MIFRMDVDPYDIRRLASKLDRWSLFGTQWSESPELSIQNHLSMSSICPLKDLFVRYFTAITKASTACKPLVAAPTVETGHLT